jgi:hypothetical protein
MGTMTRDQVGDVEAGPATGPRAAVGRGAWRREQRRWRRWIEKKCFKVRFRHCGTHGERGLCAGTKSSKTSVTPTDECTGLCSSVDVIFLSFDTDEYISQLYSSVLITRNISQLYSLVARNIKAIRNVPNFPIVYFKIP